MSNLAMLRKLDRIEKLAAGLAEKIDEGYSPQYAAKKFFYFSWDNNRNLLLGNDLIRSAWFRYMEKNRSRGVNCYAQIPVKVKRAMARKINHT